MALKLEGVLAGEMLGPQHCPPQRSAISCEFRRPWARPDSPRHPPTLLTTSYITVGLLVDAISLWKYPREGPDQECSEIMRRHFWAMAALLLGGEIDTYDFIHNSAAAFEI